MYSDRKMHQQGPRSQAAPLDVLGYCPRCGRDLESDYCDICQSSTIDRAEEANGIVRDCDPDR
jgi:hypothetical protein